MDAPLRRHWLLGGPLAAVALASGCGLFDRETDKRVSDLLKSGKEPPAHLERGQAPAEKPLPPVKLPPQEQEKPLPAVELSKPITPAKVVPLSGRPDVVPAGTTSAKSPVTPVDARVTAEATTATTGVKAVATIGSDVIITDEEVSLIMKQRAADYFDLKGDERVKKEKEVYRDCLRLLIERELILADFLGKVKKNKPGVLDELWEQAGRMADDQLRAMRKAYKAKKLDTEAEFAKVLDEQGLPYKLFRRQIERASMVNLFLGSMLKEKRGQPTLAEVQDYYARNKAEFKTEDRVKYLHLFVSHSRFDTPAQAKQYADNLFKQALGGADFAALIKQSGHGDSPLRDGMGIGEKRGEIQPAELEAVVFDTKAGNISGVTATETGYHVVKVTERQVAGFRPFDEKMQNDIRYKLMDNSAKVEREKLVAELWRRIGVTIVDER